MHEGDLGQLGCRPRDVHVVDPKEGQTLHLLVDPEDHVGRINDRAPRAVLRVRVSRVLAERHPPLGSVRAQHRRVRLPGAQQQVPDPVRRHRRQQPPQVVQVHDDVIVRPDHVPGARAVVGRVLEGHGVLISHVVVRVDEVALHQVAVERALLAEDGAREGVVGGAQEEERHQVADAASEPCVAQHGAALVVAGRRVDQRQDEGPQAGAVARRVGPHHERELAQVDERACVRRRQLRQRVRVVRGRVGDQRLERDRLREHVPVGRQLLGTVNEQCQERRAQQQR